MYKEIFDKSTDGMLIMIDGKVSECNESVLTMFGYETKEEFFKIPFAQLSPEFQPDGKKSEEKSLENIKVLTQEGRKSFEWIHLKANGEPFWVEVVLSHLSKNSDEFRLLVVWRKIDEKKRLEEENFSQNMLLNSVLNSTNEIIFYKDYLHNNGKYIGCNPSYEALLGKSKNEIIGYTDIDLFGKSKGELFREHDVAVMKKQAMIPITVWMQYPNGDKAFFETMKSPLKDKHGKVIGVIGIARDITDTYRYQEALKESAKKNKILANTDALTGVMNRRAIFKRSHKLYENQEQEIAVLMLDVDNFKQVNDTYGHEKGDLVLQHIVAICSKNLREEDLLGRLGGEEFLIVLNNTQKNQAQEVAARLIKEISLEQISDDKISVTVSIGIAMSGTNKYGSFSEILNDADKTLYKAKASGKNQYQLCSLDHKEL